MQFRQPLDGAAEKLYEYAQDVPVIDTHEHIPRSEAEYNAKTIRFGNLFNPYVSNDLASAGMPFPPGEWAASVCIDDDWDAFEPHWNAVKFGSYARPIRIALQKFYGVDDFTRDNYLDIVQRINDNNTPGIYKRVYKDTCGIERVVRCSGNLPDRDDPILVGNIISPAGQVTSKGSVDTMAADVGAAGAASLDEFMAISDAWMELQVSNGGIEFKTVAIAAEVPDRTKAEEAFQLVAGGEELPSDLDNHLRAFVREANARKAAELGVPLAIHTGVWGDFRTANVQHLIGFIERNPGTRMDIFHLSIPDVRSAVQVVKNFPNAYMNLCWAHIVAPDMVVATMKEAVDMVPLNKVFAFGADYILFIEKVYGHLLMAKENLATVLGDRVDRNLMGLDDAKQTLRAWFYENPKAFYGL